MRLGGRAEPSPFRPKGNAIVFSHIRRAVACAVAALTLIAATALADLTVDVSPETPVTYQPLTVHAWTMLGDPGQSHVQTTWHWSAGDIVVDVIMHDRHEPGSIWPAIVMQGGGSVDIAGLAPGHYKVNATMLMVPWWETPPNGGVLYDAGSTVFDVTLPDLSWPSLVESYGGLLSGRDDQLRAFREFYLRSLPAGDTLVGAFYASLPLLSDAVKKDSVFRSATWLLLAPSVAVADYAVQGR